MRLLHIVAGGAALALLAAAAPPADAGTRFNFNKFPFIFDDGYDNDDFYYEDPPPPRRRALRRKLRQREREEERYFSREEDEPDRYGIYEPEFEEDVIEVPPRKRLDKVRKAKKSDESPPAAKPQKKKRAAIADPPVKPKPKPKPKVAAKPAEPAADTALQETGTIAPAEKAAAAGGALSCEQATGIVSDYGFGEVKPTSCKGEVYAFRASRAGKVYAIKLAADSGELTEVAKQ